MDNEYIRDLWNVFRSDATARACSDLIQGYVMGLGVEAVSDQRHVDRYWMPFMRDAVDNFLVQGFVAFRLITETDGRQHPELVTVFAGDFMINGHTEFGFKPFDQINIEKGICFHFTDVPLGVLPVSCMRAYHRVAVFVLSEERNAAIAGASRARPTVITTSSTDRTFDERSLVSLENAAAGQPRIAAARRNMAARNMLNVEMFRELERPIQTSDNPVDPVTGTTLFYVPSSEGGASVVPDLVPLPNDAMVAANVPMAHAREDLVQLARYGREQCCLAFGLTPEAVLGANTNKMASSEVAYLESRVRISVSRYVAALKLLFSLCGVVGEVRFMAAQTPTIMRRLVADGVVNMEAYAQTAATYYSLTPDQIRRNLPSYLLTESNRNQDEWNSRPKRKHEELRDPG